MPVTPCPLLELGEKTPASARTERTTTTATAAATIAIRNPRRRGGGVGGGTNHGGEGGGCTVSCEGGVATGAGGRGYVGSGVALIEGRTVGSYFNLGPDLALPQRIPAPAPFSTSGTGEHTRRAQGDPRAKRLRLEIRFICAKALGRACVRRPGGP